MFKATKLFVAATLAGGFALSAQAQTMDVAAMTCADFSALDMTGQTAAIDAAMMTSGYSNTSAEQSAGRKSTDKAEAQTNEGGTTTIDGSVPADTSTGQSAGNRSTDKAEAIGNQGTTAGSTPPAADTSTGQSSGNKSSDMAEGSTVPDSTGAADTTTENAANLTSAEVATLTATTCTMQPETLVVDAMMARP